MDENEQQENFLIQEEADPTLNTDTHLIIEAKKMEEQNNNRL